MVVAVFDPDNAYKRKGVRRQTADVPFVASLELAAFVTADRLNKELMECKMENPMPEETLPAASFEAYENGKHRRYSLLFAVNGGAFAVAKILHDCKATVLGNLTLRELAIGMALFTIVMTIDIFMFGQRMRAVYLPGAFSWQGKLVLAMVGVLICLGWLLVAG